MLDLTRVLAGPWCTQLLADLGADVVKVERPGSGDDTRGWGPPFLRDAQGHDTSEAAYYLAANRGKRSVPIDIAHPEGQALVRRLAERADVVVENYKVGQLANYGLDYATLSAANPRLVYCSITGFGQTGPHEDRAGYDFIIQGMGGFMSITGERDDLPGGGPQKAGVAVSDLMTGMYATVAILAALEHRDTQRPRPAHRHGAHRHHGRDARQHEHELPDDRHGARARGQRAPEHRALPGVRRRRRPRDHRRRQRCPVRQVLRGRRPSGPGERSALREATPTGCAIARCSCRCSRRSCAAQPVRFWAEGLEAAGVPCGPINSIAQAFADPQVQARGMRIDLPHPLAGQVPLVANPIKLSATPPRFERAPPLLGQHTDEVLRGELGLDARASPRCV